MPSTSYPTRSVMPKDGSTNSYQISSTTFNKNYKTFEEDFKDTVYVSSSAYINSKGIEGGEGFNGAEKFHRVIDVWDSGWNQKVGTVPPEEVRKTTTLARAKYPDKRIISHFMQPTNLF